MVGKAGLVASFALTIGFVIFLAGLFDVLNPTLLPVGPWSPGAPLPPLEYVNAFPEPLTLVGGLALMTLGTVAILLNPSRSSSKNAAIRQSFSGNQGPDDEALQAGLAFGGDDEGIAMTHLWSSGDNREGNQTSQEKRRKGRESLEQPKENSALEDDDEEERRLAYTFQICLNCGGDLRPGSRACPKCGRAPLVID